MRELGMIISDKVLQSLCQKHLHEIGAGIDTFLPDIIVRYVSENKKFGYTRFGNFFSLAMTSMYGRKTISMQKTIIRMW